MDGRSGYPEDLLFPQQSPRSLPEYSTIGPPMFPLKISMFSANSSIVAGVLPSTITRITPPCTVANSSQERGAKSVFCLSSVDVWCIDSIRKLLVKVRVAQPWVVSLVHAQLDPCYKPRHAGEAIPASCSGAMGTRDGYRTPLIPPSAPCGFFACGRGSLPPCLALRRIASVTRMACLACATRRHNGRGSHVTGCAFAGQPTVAL